MRSGKRYTNVTFTKRVDHEAGKHRAAKAAPGPRVCRTCGSAYLKRRWVKADRAPAHLFSPTQPPLETVCPACRMVAEGTWRGELRISGAFPAAHKDEIEHLLRAEAQRAGEDNPLARITTTTPRGRQGLTVRTTTEHLAKRLGQALAKAYDGTAHYEFSHENKFAHVTWTRDK